MANNTNTGEYFSSVQLKYTSVICYSEDLKSALFVTNNFLWKPIDNRNNLIANVIPAHSRDNYRCIDNFSHIRELGYDCSLDGTVNDAEQFVNVNLKSNTQAEFIESQLTLLKRYTTYGTKTIVFDAHKFAQAFQNGKNTKLVQQIEEVSKIYGVEVIVSSQIKNFTLKEYMPQTTFNTPHNSWFVYVIGEVNDISAAEVDIRVLMDNASSQCVNCLNLPLSLIPLLGGLNFGNFNSIAKETGVNIYLPNLLPNLTSLVEKKPMNLLYVSGLESEVQLTTKLLLDIKDDTDFQIFYKSIEMLKFKKDFIILNKQKEVSAIIYKYGVFIQLSPLGSNVSTVHFQGPSNDLIEASITEFLNLASDILLTDIQLDGLSGSLLCDVSNGGQLRHLQEIIRGSNSLLSFNSEDNSLQMIGLKKDLTGALKLIENKLLILHKNALSSFVIPVAIKTDLELNLTYYEFISGKKNGKIIKILNSSNGSSKVQFSPLNDYTFKVELSSNNVNTFISSFNNLENEFPSECKFFIPESFHRQIIGTGGSLIQSIMRKYNVFVKFSNQSELNSILQKRNLIRFDNVIVRCPSKNSSNIPLVRQELNSLIFNNNENNGILNTFVKISKTQYKLLKFNKIQQIEKKNMVFIKLPISAFKEPFHIVEISGVEKSSVAAAKELIDELPHTYEFKISFSSKFSKVFNESNEIFLAKIKTPLKLLYNFELLAVDHLNSQSSSDAQPYHSVLLNYLPENEVFLEDVSTHLTHFLRENEFMILDRAELMNKDLLINGSAANSQPLQTQQFQFNQQHVYPNFQKMNGSSDMGAINPPEKPPQQLNPSSMFYSPQKHLLTPSNNIYNFNNSNIPKYDKPSKRPNTSHNGYDSNNRRGDSKRQFNFKRPI